MVLPDVVHCICLLHSVVSRHYLYYPRSLSSQKWKRRLSYSPMRFKPIWGVLTTTRLRLKDAWPILHQDDRKHVGSTRVVATEVPYFLWYLIQKVLSSKSSSMTRVSSLIAGGDSRCSHGLGPHSGPAIYIKELVRSYMIWSRFASIVTLIAVG